MIYTLSKTFFPIFHWAQAAPTSYRNESPCGSFVSGTRVCVAYTAAYVQSFRHLPRHRQSVPYDARSVLNGWVTVEECARRCILSTTVQGRCHGFNYKPLSQSRPCTLIYAGPRLPTVYAHDTDFYHRQPGL